MLAKGRLFAQAVVTGGVLVLMGCGGSSSSPASAAGFDKSLDALCAASVAFDRSLPNLKASQHLSDAQVLAKVKAEDVTLHAAQARLTPPGSLTGALHTLTQDQASPPASPSTPTAASITALLTWERKLARDYTGLGATGCAASEQQSIASMEALAKKLHLSSLR